MRHTEIARARKPDDLAERRRSHTEARPAPALDPREIARLQATAGNQAVQRLLGVRRPSGPMLQRVTTGEDLEADKALARQLVDPLLKQYFIGQSLTSLDDDREKRKDQRVAELIKGMDFLDSKFIDALNSAQATAQQEYEAEEPIYAPMKAAYQEGDRISRGLDLVAKDKFKTEKFVQKLDYWREKAKRVQSEKRTRLGADEKGEGGRLPLWCDHATALVISLLSDKPAFKSSLDVIRQGDPHVSGHWYVLANREGDPTYGRKLTENEFLIDLWGAILRELPTTVLDSRSSYPKADYAGVMNLLQIPKLESVMTVRQGTVEGDEDFDALLAQLLASEQPIQPKDLDQMLADAFTAGEGVQDLDDLLATLGEPKATGSTPAAATGGSDGDS
jgi:hypothetical protein